MGPILTVASILPHAPLYFDTLGWKTESYFKLTATNLAFISGVKDLSGSTDTCDEKGADSLGLVGPVSAPGAGDSPMGSVEIGLIWQICSFFLSMIGSEVSLVSLTV